MHADTKHGMEELINPLIGPDPSDETGPNSHFRSTFAPTQSNAYPSPPTSSSATTKDTNPFRKSNSLSNSIGSPPSTAALEYPSPPTSASPRRSRFQESSLTPSSDSSSPPSPPGVRRSSSLRQRYPGDHTHKPLDMLRSSAKAAHRSPHLRKKQLPVTDTIDRLDADPLGFSYHHEGPYDAALHSRNKITKYSPLAAVSQSNAETLKATPIENIIDAVEKHHPLDGVAAVPSGGRDMFGRLYEYEQGTNMAREEGGQYKIWPATDAPPEEIYARDGASHRSHKKSSSLSNAIEMTSRPRNKSLSHADSVQRHNDDQISSKEEMGIKRSHTTGKRMTEGLKRRFGSLKKRKEQNI